MDRMAIAGATKTCFVVSPQTSDIMSYYGDHCDCVDIAQVVQPRLSGLCNAIFRAHSLIPRNEPVVVGLPEPIWFSEDALTTLANDHLSFLLFPVEQPELFDAVVTDEVGQVLAIYVKARSRWVWGAFKMPGHVLHELRSFWRPDPSLTSTSALWSTPGSPRAARRPPFEPASLPDVGTLDGDRAAMELLGPAPENLPAVARAAR